MEKTKTKTILRSGALVLTGMMCVGAIPAGLTTLKVGASTDLGKESIYLLNAKDSAVKGEVYKIRQAYFGGTARIPFGLTSGSYAYDDIESEVNGVTNIESSITVTYANGVSIDVTKTTDDKSLGQTETGDKIYGTFPVEYAGEYTITYSMTIDGKTYSMNYKVNSEKSTASFSFENTNNDAIPTIYDMNYSKAKEGESYKKVKFSKPVIYDAEGKKIDIDNDAFVYSKAQATGKSDFVVVSVTNGKTPIASSGLNITADGEVEITEALTAGKYTITYKYYSKAPTSESAQFVADASRSFEVKNDTDTEGKGVAYYNDYELKINTNSTPTFVTKVETVLPTITATGKFKDVSGASVTEEANVTYTVKAFISESAGTYTKEVTATDIYKNEDGKWAFKPSKDGRYQIVYEATDFYGHKAETRITTSDVKDTEKPVAYIYDASDLTNDVANGKFNDASSKLKTKAFKENVVIYAVGGTDNVAIKNLQRRLYYTSSNQITIEGYNGYNLIFGYNYDSLRTQNYLIDQAMTSVTNEEQAKEWLKTNNYLIVRTNKEFAEIASVLGTDNKINGLEINETNKKAIREYLAENEELLAGKGIAYVDTDYSLSLGSYTVYYEATDTAGNSNKSDDTAYSINITNTSDIDAQAPEITFSTVLEDSYTTKDVVTFSAPTVVDDIDSRKYTDIYYEYKLGESSYSEKHYFEDEKYSIDLSKAPETAVGVRITVYAEDDFGNKATLTKEFAISDVNDSDVPVFVSESDGSSYTGLTQGQEVELPTLTYRDSYADIMNYNVRITAIDGTTRRDISYFDDFSSWNLSGLKKNFVLSAGKFVAAYAGKYEVSITVSDPAGNHITNFYNYTVNTNVEDYFKLICSGSINGSGTAEAGEAVTFAVPTLSYTLADSNQALYGIADEDTKAVKNFSIEKVSGGSITKKSNTTYVLEEQGTYKFKYKAYFSIYDTTLMSADDKGVFVEESGTKYYAYMNGDNVAFESEAGATLSDVSAYQGKYKEIVQESDVKSITVSAKSESKKFSVDGTYDPSYSKGTWVSILSVDGLGADVDMEKSTVTISHKSDAANGTTAVVKLSDLTNSSFTATSSLKFEDGTIKVLLSRDATYTVSYKIQDKNGNPYTSDKSTFTFTVGDVEPPVISAKEGFIKDEYKKGSTLSIDLGKLNFKDDATAEDELKGNVKVKVYNESTKKEAENVEGEPLQFILDEVGTYTLTVTTEDGAGVIGKYTSEFEVTASGATDTTKTYQTVGTILIVVASILLVGIIAYFVVSKIRRNNKVKGKDVKKRK